MLVKAIADKFNAYYEQSPDHDTILWFDPQREWEGLLPYLQPHLPLLIFEGSQLHLRYQLVSRSPGQRFVVYLPFKSIKSAAERGEAEYMRPFVYTSRIFDATIEAILRDQGVALPDAPGAMRSLRPLLPALAVASVGKGRAFWEGVVNLETALARLIPDFDDLLLRLLAFPAQTIAELEVRQVAGPFLNLLKGQFGVAPPETGFFPKTPVSEMNEWADRFTATLCLVDVYLAAGQPAGFPFQSVLPDPVHWDRCRNFLHKWQRDEMFKDAFARRARAVDGQYSLASWVKGLPQPPVTGAFLNVERAVWEGVRAELDSIADKPQAVAFCRSQRETFRQRAQSFWAREGSLAGWAALDRMAEVVIGADDALAELLRFAYPPRPPRNGGESTVQALIGRYTQEWWQVDRAYRRFRAELNSPRGRGLEQCSPRGRGSEQWGVSHLDSALKWTQRIYQDFLEDVNDRFVKALTQEGRWPPGGVALGAGELWESTLPPRRGPGAGPGAVGGGQGRRAVVFVDALRYELGQELAERLQPGPQATPDAALSPLPSVTALGMAALLPGWPDFRVDYANGKWVITAPGFEGNVAVKTRRLAWLEQHLGNVAAFDLDQWLTTPLSEVAEDVTWIIITSTEIDAVGEGAGTVAWHTLDALLDRLEQAVRRLLALGCAEVHVVSDHGFLLRENIRESDKVAVDVEGVLKKAERYLVGRDLPPTDLPAMPVSGSDSLTAWFPRGVGCFVTPGPYDFMHGGVSLQELVTAHVTVRQSVTERPVGVTLELVTGPEIRNAIFKVRLVPQGVDLWTRARQVKVDIACEGERVSREWEAVVERDVVTMSLRLEPDSGLAVGDGITIRAWDAVTGELLAQQPAVVQVDLDW